MSKDIENLLKPEKKAYYGEDAVPPRDHLVLSLLKSMTNEGIVPNARTFEVLNLLERHTKWTRATRDSFRVYFGTLRAIEQTALAAGEKDRVKLSAIQRASNKNSHNNKKTRNTRRKE